MNTVEGLGPAAGPQPLTSVLLRRADRGPARPRGTSWAGPGAAAPAVWGNGSATARFRTGASGHPGPGDWWQVMKPSNRFSIASSDGSPPMACHRVHLLAKDSRTRKASDMELTTKKAVPPRTSHGELLGRTTQHRGHRTLLRPALPDGGGDASPPREVSRHLAESSRTRTTSESPQHCRAVAPMGCSERLAARARPAIRSSTPLVRHTGRQGA